MALQGLSSEEAARVLERVGPNSIPVERASMSARIVGKLWAPVPWMLEVTVLLEIVLGKWADASVIAVVLGLNVVLGVVQERRAESALDLLRARLEVNARVLRDGTWSLRPAAGIVPGDVIRVRVGDLVPADLHLHEGLVQADQASLTGESTPVDRGPEADLYSGSVVTRGEATGTATATGTRTYFGRTAELVGTSAPAAHLEVLVLRMVRVFIVFDLVLAVAGSLYLALARAPMGEIVSYAVVLLLASVPVALPAAFALAGALGARRLAGAGILTTRPAILQEAASMDVLCVDKTGTLTSNMLSVEGVAPSDCIDAAALLSWAAAASDEATQDPIDLAIIRKAQSFPAWSRIQFIPFDPATKRSEAVLQTPSGIVRVAKGAPSVVATLTGKDAAGAVDDLASGGARVLAVAATDLAGSWRELGLIGLADAPRTEAAALLSHLRHLGIRVIMVTGDSTATAAAIAGKIGLGGRAVTAQTLSAADWRVGDEVAVVAQVLPEHKHHLVKELQAAGHRVGMTGDGVNDAPALRQADVGIAVEGATDVAKAAAGAVLTRSGLGDIIGLIEESRRIHQRSLTYALNVSVKKLEVPLVLAFGVFAWRQFLFTPLLMALLLLANDVVSMAITTDRADFSRTPDRWSVRTVITGALIVAAPLLVISLAVLWTAHDIWPPLGIEQLRTLIFISLVVSSQLTIYLVRTGSRMWAEPPSPWLLTASAADLAAALLLALLGWFMAPLPLGLIAAAVGAVAVGATISDLLKVRAFHSLRIHST